MEQKPETLRDLERTLKTLLSQQPVQVQLRVGSDNRTFTLVSRIGDSRHETTGSLANPILGYQLRAIRDKIKPPYVAGIREGNDETYLTIVQGPTFS